MLKITASLTIQGGTLILWTCLMPNFNSYTIYKRRISSINYGYTASLFPALKKHAFLSSFLILQNPTCVPSDICVTATWLPVTKGYWSNTCRALKDLLELVQFTMKLGHLLSQLHAGSTTSNTKVISWESTNFFVGNKNYYDCKNKEKIVYQSQRLFQRKYYRPQTVNKTMFNMLMIPWCSWIFW